MALFRSVDVSPNCKVYVLRLFQNTSTPGRARPDRAQALGDHARRGARDAGAGTVAWHDAAAAVVGQRQMNVYPPSADEL